MFAPNDVSSWYDASISSANTSDRQLRHWLANLHFLFCAHIALLCSPCMQQDRQRVKLGHYRFKRGCQRGTQGKISLLRVETGSAAGS